ncbi:BspA family leucine-rich repeat surface protein [Acinetobacter baumannii]|uniref:BspA family leucine-rich repeat surface protein n=1 Tax=Acinetobacter baumannii TaxID=470 RepID=UPI0022B4A72D|nr:BspA family leucine-rich repeat surface protein [Acinetobacter baumannii]
MSNTLLLKTDGSINTRSKVFPKLGKCNIAIYRRTNGADEVELWTWGLSHAENPITINGGKFVAWAANVPDRLVVPKNPIAIDTTELTLPRQIVCYFKIKIDDGLKSCQLMFNNYLTDTSLCGGNKPDQMKIDYSRRPYTINSMAKMFWNQFVAYDLSDWDMSDVVYAVSMFHNSPNFNQDLSLWDVRKITEFSSMFQGTPFNQPLNSWVTESAVAFAGMFANCVDFNQPLDKWNTSKVSDFSSMFGWAKSFNQPIGNWDTSSATNISYMFENAHAFNQDLNDWNVQKVEYMDGLFKYAKSFNQPLSNWDTRSVVTASQMFMGAESFNQTIENLNFSKCTALRMFMHQAKSFNKPVAALDVSVCTDLAQFFEEALSFNQPVESWNVSACLDMWRMFAYATAFDQPLAAWCPKFNVEVSLDSFMEGKAYRTSYYDDFLNALWLDVNTTRRNQWASRIKPRLLGMGLSKYSSVSSSARANLVSAGWTITDGGQV